MIENSFVFAVEQAVKKDEKKKSQSQSKASEKLRLKRLIRSNHKEEVEAKGFAGVKCNNWKKADQIRVLKLFLLQGYKAKTIKKSWNLDKIYFNELKKYKKKYKGRQ